jgi:hypothetical protein
MDTKVIVNRFHSLKYDLAYEHYDSSGRHRHAESKTIPPSHDICLAIPFGQKCLLWFTFYEGSHVVVLMSLGKDRQISDTKFLNVKNLERIPRIHLGTLLMGCLYQDRGSPTYNFVFEECLQFQGNYVKNFRFSDKLAFFLNVADYMNTLGDPLLKVSLPVLWKRGDVSPVITYNVHHYQYRSWNECKPCIARTVFHEMPPPKFGKMPKVGEGSVGSNLGKMGNLENLGKMPKRHMKPNNVFIIRADTQADTYHLYEANTSNGLVYCDVACIPNYKTSVWMNSIFRNIKENRNLDAIEESDDEEEFESCSKEERFVDLAKQVFMECEFHPKFRKWVPMKIRD